MKLGSSFYCFSADSAFVCVCVSQVNTNDNMMSIYVASLIRSICALHDLISNKIVNKISEIEEGKTEAEKKEEKRLAAQAVEDKKKKEKEEEEKKKREKAEAGKGKKKKTSEE